MLPAFTIRVPAVPLIVLLIAMSLSALNVSDAVLSHVTGDATVMLPRSGSLLVPALETMTLVPCSEHATHN